MGINGGVFMAIGIAPLMWQLRFNHYKELEVIEGALGPFYFALGYGSD